MSRIARVELFHVEIPLDEPFHPSWIPGYPQTQNRMTLIRLTTDDGIVGVSAGTAFEREREGLGSLLGPYLIGADATNLSEIRQRLTEASFLGWHNWWIEPAFWDIRGKLEGKPVYRLINPEIGPVERVPVYASTGSVRPIPERLAYLDRIRDMGITAVKLRVHSFDEREDLAIVEAARRHLGSGFTIAVDANQGWRVALIDDAPLWDLERATRFARAIEPLEVAWLEEPLEMHDYEGLAQLRKSTTTPIAGGELLSGWHDVRTAFERGSLDLYQPDAMFCGGLETSRRVLAQCRIEGLSFSPHTWTNGIGLLVNLHAFAAHPERHVLEYPFEPPGWTPAGRDGILAQPIEVAPDGTIAVPQEPGLGIHLDERALARHGHRFFRMTKASLAIHTIRTKGLRTALDLKRRKDRRGSGPTS